MSRITLNEPWRKLVWVATTVCNYNCSYCAPNLHDSANRWPSNYKPVLAMINKFRGNSPLIVDITGGEPTLWPEFETFCTDLVESSSAKTSIQFTTNGARSIRYWDNFSAPVDEICFSFHTEFASEEHFLKVAKSLHLRYNVKIFLMVPPDQLARMQEFYNTLESSDLQIDVAIKLIKQQNGAGLVDGYTSEHHQFAVQRIKRAKYNGVKRIDTATVFYNNNEISAQDLINTAQDRFLGWSCNVGIDRLCIEPNGDIYGSTCYITEPYGNVNDIDNVVLPSAPVTCTKEYCGCGADVAIPKWDTDV